MGSQIPSARIKTNEIVRIFMGDASHADTDCGLARRKESQRRRTEKPGAPSVEAYVRAKVTTGDDDGGIRVLAEREASAISGTAGQPPCTASTAVVGW